MGIFCCWLGGEEKEEEGGCLLSHAGARHCLHERGEVVVVVSSRAGLAFCLRCCCFLL